MAPPAQLVVFTLGEQRYALHLSAVERIVLMAEMTPLPDAPPIVLGIINVQGRIIPIVDIRRRFNLPEREFSLSDHMIIARTARRAVILPVEAVLGVVERSEDEMTAAGGILPNLEYIEGVVKFEDGLILIHDLETFLSLEEEKEIEQAMSHI